MFKIFRNIGFITLVLVSFIYTDKLVSVVKESDNLMIEIKEKSKNYEIKAKDAIIEKDTIIPGVKGTSIDLEETYKKMKQYGKYDERLIVYKSVNPKNNLASNKDKYIIKGNRKNKVSLIVLISDIITLKRIDDKTNIFIDSNIFLKNSKEITKIKNNIIGISGNNYDDYKEIDNVIKHILKNKNGYCYTKEKNEKILDLCYKLDNYTIMSNIEIKNKSLINLKNELNDGAIIVINEDSIDYLKIVENYVESKGYEIVNLDELLYETN